MIKRKLVYSILILIAISFAPIATKAQESTDSTATTTRTKGLKLGVFLGGSSYLGELKNVGANLGTGRWENKRQTLCSVMSLSAKYDFENKNLFLSLIEMETSLSYTVISGDDAFSGDMYRRMRNLHFKSRIFEFSNQFQIGLPYRFSPYLTFGFSVFNFDPKAQYLDGSWHRLKPFGTEGQWDIPSREMYSNFSYAIPFGIGLKYLVSKKLELQLSYVYRKTFTDYLDDVSTTYGDRYLIRNRYGKVAAYLADPSLFPYSPDFNPTAPGEQRGDPGDNDAYYFYGFTVFYTIK